VPNQDFLPKWSCVDAINVEKCGVALTNVGAGIPILDGKKLTWMRTSYIPSHFGILIIVNLGNPEV